MSQSCKSICVCSFHVKENIFVNRSVEQCMISSLSVGGAESVEDASTNLVYTSVSERQGAATTTATDRLSSL